MIRLEEVSIESDSPEERVDLDGPDQPASGDDEVLAERETLLDRASEDTTGPLDREGPEDGDAESSRPEVEDRAENELCEAEVTDPEATGPEATGPETFGDDVASDASGETFVESEANASDADEPAILDQGGVAGASEAALDSGAERQIADPEGSAEPEILVRPRPELAAALEREGVETDEDYDRAIPEVDQLVSDDAEEQLAEPMLAEPAFEDPEGGDPESEGPESSAADTDGAGEVAEDAAPETRASSGSLPDVPEELPLEAAVSAPVVDDDAEVPELTEPGPLSRVLVAVLLTSKEPLKLVRLAEVCNSSQKAVEAALERLDDDLRAMGMPLEVIHAGEAIRLGTAPEVFPYLARLRKARKAERLSPAALETLAVVAYQQPVIRLEIEAIRGVKVGPMLKSLLDHKLVKVVGRADVPGRPLQYGTTQVFLERFGLRSLKDLPSVQEFRSLG